nr:hypothetical protein Iba_chr01bCG4190 [Ipomoea batatas]GMC49052.1 hypothetical protein Iba_chr01bCG4200 [Ipomoea batatas]GMD31553.1 hypothetical protein Iba_scaffold43712CG0010 [Ipomoea batatas]
MGTGSIDKSIRIIFWIGGTKSSRPAWLKLGLRFSGMRGRDYRGTTREIETQQRWVQCSSVEKELDFLEGPPKHVENKQLNSQ